MLGWAVPAHRAAGFDPTVFQDFSDIFREFFGFGDIFGGGGGGAVVAALSVVPIFEKTSLWSLKRLSLVPSRR